MPTLSYWLPMAPAFNAGMALSLSLIMALGAQNAHVIRMGLQGQHVLLTVALCVVSDALLIGIGVFGLAQLGGLSPLVKTLLILGGIMFLLVYGYQAFQRFMAGAAQRIGSEGGVSSQTPSQMTRMQATTAALAFAWLNPHAWLDTAVLIGTASLAWGQPGHAAFGAGAATGSAVWFCGLGLGVFWLGQRLNNPAIWRVLDGLVALMMWGTAAVLAWGLLQGA